MVFVYSISYCSEQQKELIQSCGAWWGGLCIFRRERSCSHSRQGSENVQNRSLSPWGVDVAEGIGTAEGVGVAEWGY